MKNILLVIAIVVSSILSNQAFAQNLPSINKSTKAFDLYMGDDDTPLMYGYESADISSKKMICFSSFTADVQDNPHKCVLGAYYVTEDINIEYISTEGNFVKLKFMASGKSDVIFYMEKKSVRFE